MRAFLKAAFSDNGLPSSSRLLTGVHSAVACGCLIAAVVHNRGSLPDAIAVGGLGAFATVHYAVNRVTTAFGRRGDLTPGQQQPG